GAEPGQGSAALPVRPPAASLKTVTTHNYGMLLLDVTKTRNINAVGPTAHFHAVLVAEDGAACATAHHMVHDVVAQLSAGIRQAVGKFRACRVEKNARGFQRRRTEKYNTAAEFQSLAGLGIDNANAGYFSRFGVKHQTVHHAVRAQGKLPGFASRGQRGIKAAEI